VASIHDAENRQLVERTRLWLGALGSSVVVAVNSPENVMHTPGPWLVSAPAHVDGAPDFAVYVEIDGKKHIIAEASRFHPTAHDRIAEHGK
jgi:hypothetical protein